MCIYIYTYPYIYRHHKQRSVNTSNTCEGRQFPHGWCHLRSGKSRSHVTSQESLGIEPEEAHDVKRIIKHWNLTIENGYFLGITNFL